MRASFFLFIRPDLHLGKFQRVEEAVKRIPGDAVKVLAFTVQVFAAQVGFTAISVPPASFFYGCAVTL